METILRLFLKALDSAVDNFLWMVYSTHHGSEIWCTQKPEDVAV